MSLIARLFDATRRSSGGSAARCEADWRRPDGYWRCTREAGHRGRHRMRAAPRSSGAARDRRPGSGQGGIATG